MCNNWCTGNTFNNNLGYNGYNTSNDFFITDAVYNNAAFNNGFGFQNNTGFQNRNFQCQNNTCNAFRAGFQAGCNSARYCNR